MNTLSGDNLLKLDYVKAQIEARDREIANPYVKDTQVMNIHNARKYIGDRLIRTAKPHRILDPAQGPLIAVKLNILTRKTLGGFETDLDSRVFGSEGQIMPGLYAAGEAAGFGGGGMHGYRSLEGTFLGGCLFSGTECRTGGGEGGGIGANDLRFQCAAVIPVPNSAFRKNFFDILTSIEHTYDFRTVIVQAIEHNMGAGGERAQARSDFIARPSCQRKVVNCRNNPGNFAQKFVGYYASCRASVVFP